LCDALGDGLPKDDVPAQKMTTHLGFYFLGLKIFGLFDVIINHENLCLLIDAIESMMTNLQELHLKDYFQRMV
jgi:hypothetical protein